MVELMILSRGAGVAHGPFSKRRHFKVGLAVLGLFWACGCNRQLPPAPTPKAVAPDVAPAAPRAEGEGQLIIDVVDGPTQVQRIRMQATSVTDEQGRTRYEFIESPEILCAATPCVVNLPVGNVVLGFPVVSSPGSMDVELVHVESEATVYRRALTFHKPRQRGPGRTLGIVSTAFGGTAMAAGAALLPIGLAKDVDGLTLAGSISLGAGTALVAVGIWAMWGSSSTYRPGSAIHFSF